MTQMTNAWLWFNLFLAVVLLVDLGVFNRKAHKVTSKESAIWTGVWISLALAFNAGVFFLMGNEAGAEWLTGYVIEKALSVDNVFVFAILMTAFKVPDQYQHRLLFFGVVGALVMRLCLILGGAYLLQHWHWLFYVFGAFLIFTGWRMFSSEEELQPQNSPIMAWIQRVIPMSSDFHGSKMFVRQDGKLLGTPFLLALVCIEFTDLIFAIDSIPAIFAITEDPFIVYTSNAFAVLGLRSLYFLLADALSKFHYLKHGLGIILAIVGAKMVAKDVVHIPVLWSLLAIVGVLVGAILYSLKHPLRTDSPKQKVPAERG
jgi:tellurite resistance protein TerC